jgi:DNA-binding NtrC family response regulator
MPLLISRATASPYDHFTAKISKVPYNHDSNVWEKMMKNSDITILLVDDDEMMLECLGTYFEDEGFIMHYANCGEEALESIAAINPAVCITDMRLPGMNGEAFIGKAHAICPNTGYLLHTGMLYSPSVELLTLGITAADVFQKPIHDFSKLIDRIIAIAKRVRT